ncbi:hypothetical protein Q5752_006323 [Cryptotrichosporon argae]
MTTTRLATHHHLLLELAHVLSLLGTVLLLLLPGVSGPGAGFFWLEISYADAAVAAGTWEVGARGSCEVGQRCSVGQASPAHVSVVRSALAWHLAAAALFAASTLATAALIHCPPRMLYTAWITFLLPFLPVLVVIMTLAVDFGIKQTLATRADIDALRALPCFWLTPPALALSLAWAAAAHALRWLGLQVVEDADEVRRRRRRERHEERERRKRAREPTAVERWNPWSAWNRSHLATCLAVCDEHLARVKQEIASGVHEYGRPFLPPPDVKPHGFVLPPGTPNIGGSLSVYKKSSREAMVFVEECIPLCSSASSEW